MTSETGAPTVTEAPSAIERARAWLADADQVDLVLRFSIVAVVVASHYDPRALVVSGLVAVALLANRRLLHHPVTWLVGGALLAVWQVPRWYQFDNHVWFTTYWIVAVGLCLCTEDVRSALRTDGRLLVGLIFALAAMWKLGSADFRAGHFFEYSLLQDTRFAFVAETFASLDRGVRAENHALVQGLVQDPNASVELQSADGIRPIALVFTWWGLLIEAIVALLWLVPLRSARWLRHIALLAFICTTYLVVPVGGFGCLLMAMGLTQDDDAPWLRRAYATAFVALLLYGPIWLGFFSR